MRISFLFILLSVLIACNNDNRQIITFQKQIDSLKSALADTYKPGFGEFMSNIQVHHNKLWYAGIHQNWKLADFEIHEIMESVDDIRKYQKERVESKSIEMITPVLDSVNASIKAMNTETFKANYMTLTQTCNNCHQATDFGFNVVTIPTSPPFSNQSFIPAH